MPSSHLLASCSRCWDRTHCDKNTLLCIVVVQCAQSGLAQETSPPSHYFVLPCSLPFYLLILIWPIIIGEPALDQQRAAPP